MSKKEPILVTCALPYANGPLHVGHIRSTYLPGDIYARYLRAKGTDVAFICATDEYGTPITVRADKEGKKPIEIATEYHNIIKKECAALGLSFDYFGRTSNKTNTKNAQEFFENAQEGEYIYEKEVEQYHCDTCKRFLPDRYVEGDCPNCGAAGARGDHCEKCAAALETLKNPYCMVCKQTPELKKTTHWYFKLTAFKKELETFLSKEELPANVKNYAASWLPKLQDWCITRDLSWGVPVPLKNATGKVLYVWWDAPIGYLSATEEWNKERYEEFWKSKIVHFIGKDIIYHHALFWPAQLLAHGKYALPHTIVAGEYLGLEGKKMSTSRNWVVWVDDFLKEYPADYLRFYLTINTPLTADMNFSWKEFQTRINSELSDVFGNFVHRVLTFIANKFDGEIPKDVDKKEVERVITEIKKAQTEVGNLLDKFDFLAALQRIMQLAQFGNRYFNEKEPWKNADTAGTTVHACAHLVKALSILTAPIMPTISDTIWKQLGFKTSVNTQPWDAAAEPLNVGGKTSKPTPIIQKVEIKEKDAVFSNKKVVVDPEIEEQLKSGKLSIAIGEITGVNVKNKNPEIEKLKEAAVKKTKFADVEKTIRSYDYLFEERDRGTEGVSSEALWKITKEAKQLPQINTLTDIYNSFSYGTGIVAGAYDVQAIEGDVQLHVTDGSESFIPIGSGRKSKIESGEYLLADSNKNVITRWITKEDERVKVTNYTRGAIICLSGNKEIPQNELNKKLEELLKTITEECGGKYRVLYDNSKTEAH